jgi:short-subunit dehydrogenase
MNLSAANVLLTGASRGLGRHIALALHATGAQLHLVARSQADLDNVAAECPGATTHALDVTDRAALQALTRELPVDVLVNNAGIELVAYFHELPLDEMQRILDVNLVAALTATRLVLPGMVARGRGHVVNIASLAGKSGPPLAETYAATKAGLIAFTQSLRASYAGTGVSASVVCPGFIRGEGMFADRVARNHGKPPALVGSSPPEQVGAAVVRAITKDEPELYVTPTPARLFAAIGALQPRFPGWLLRRLHLRDLYETQRHA